MIGTEFIIYDDTLSGKRVVDDYSVIEETLRWAGISSLKITMSRFAQGADLLGVAIDNEVILYVAFRQDLDNVVYLVEQVERELDENGNVTDNIIVSCREASFVSERVALPTVGQMYDAFTGPAQSAMLHYVDANAGPSAAASRQVDNLILGNDLALGEDVTVNARYDNLQELLEDIHALSPDIGWRTVLDGGVKFEAVQGNDLSASVFFSHQFDNLKNSKYLNTVLGKKNYGVVGGQGEGAARAIEYVHVGGAEPTGIRRRETFIDARDIDQDETAAGSLASRGLAKLSAMQPMASFEADMYVYGNYEYGADWMLGDLVTLKNSQWGIQRAVRVVTVVKTRSANGVDIKAELDNPWPSLKDKIKTASGSGGRGTVDYPTGGGGGGGEEAPPQPVDLKTTTLTDDVVSSINTYEQWGTETIVFQNPGTGEVKIGAWLEGWVNDTGVGGNSRRLSIVRVEISLDGGNTWSAGKDGRSETDEVNTGMLSIDVDALHAVSGTPSGNIIVRAMIRQQTTGSAGDLQWNDGRLIAQMVSSGPVVLDDRYVKEDDDTGWITLTKDSGWGAGSVNLRRRAKTVVLDFAVTIGTTSSGTRLANIPVDSRASVQIHGAGVSNSGGGVVAQIIVETDGDVMLYYPAGPGSGNALRGNLTWMVD